MNDKSEIISVVLPVYNAEEFLLKTVNSILNQTFTEFELIILDDHSSDDTLRLIDTIHDQRIKLLINEKKGAANAYNLGIENASGDLIAIIDHDDVSENSRLLKQYHYLRDHEDIDIVSSWYNIISESGRILHTVKLPVTDLEIKKKMLYECCVINSGMMIRKSVFGKYGLFIQNKFPAQDYDFFLRILTKVKFHNIPEVLHNWRSREMSPSNVAYARQREVTIEILTNHFNYLLSNSQIKKNEWCFFIGRIHYYYNSPSKSISYFWKALLKRNTSLINIRYLLFSTFLFPAIVLYRKIFVDRRYGKNFGSVSKHFKIKRNAKE